MLDNNSKEDTDTKDKDKANKLIPNNDYLKEDINAKDREQLIINSNSPKEVIDTKD